MNTYNYSFPLLSFPLFPTVLCLAMPVISTRTVMLRLTSPLLSLLPLPGEANNLPPELKPEQTARGMRILEMNDDDKSVNYSY